MCLASNVSSEIVIRSTKSWSKSDYGYSWNSDAGLSYNSTVWGETYYNSSWQDLSKPTSIQTKKVYKWFYARPDYKRDWNFTIPITNLNAEQGYSYSSKSNPDLKQMSSQIYWAIQIGFKADGVDRDITIWLKRSNKRYYEYIEGEASDSEKYIQYSVGGVTGLQVLWIIPHVHKEVLHCYVLAPILMEVHQFGGQDKN